MNTVMNNPISREVARIALKAKYPNLTMVSGEDYRENLVTAAKNIRAELKAAYPGIKFSVRTERFSMGNAIRVGWTDGPNTAQVEAITNKYKAGSFNGYEDLYEYSRSDWKDAFGSAKYVSTSRGQSESLVESGIRHIARRYGVEPITIEQYKSGGAWRWTTDSGIELDTELNRYLSKLSRAMPRKV